MTRMPYLPVSHVDKPKSSPSTQRKPIPWTHCLHERPGLLIPLVWFHPTENRTRPSSEHIQTHRPGDRMAGFQW